MCQKGIEMSICHISARILSKKAVGYYFFANGGACTGWIDMELPTVGVFPFIKRSKLYRGLNEFKGTYSKCYGRLPAMYQTLISPPHVRQKWGVLLIFAKALIRPFAFPIQSLVVIFGSFKKKKKKHAKIKIIPV